MMVLFWNTKSGINTSLDGIIFIVFLAHKLGHLPDHGFGKVPRVRGLVLFRVFSITLQDRPQNALILGSIHANLLRI